MATPGETLELVAAEEGQTPWAIRIEKSVLVAHSEGDCSRGHAADICGVRQNLLHPSIGIEGFALLYADGGKQTQCGGITSLARFFLNGFVQETPESIVAGRDKVRGNAGGIDELHFGRIGRIGELIDLQIFLDRLDAGFGRAIDEKGAKWHPVAIGTRPHNEITLGHVTGVARRQDEILAAFAMVCTRDTDVGNPSIPEVINEPQNHGRNFHNQRPFFRIKPDEAVYGVVVCRQFHGFRINQVFPDYIRPVDRSELPEVARMPTWFTMGMARR